MVLPRGETKLDAGRGRKVFERKAASFVLCPWVCLEVCDCILFLTIYQRII